jgi:hypothetical protein
MEQVDAEGQYCLITMGHSNHPPEVFVVLLKRTYQSMTTQAEQTATTKAMATMMANISKPFET